MDTSRGALLCAPWCVLGESLCNSTLETGYYTEIHKAGTKSLRAWYGNYKV